MKTTRSKVIFFLVIALGIAGVFLIFPKKQQSHFDYYQYVLSWSPEFCTTPNGQKPSKQTQCNLPLGFVIHGLWPEYNKGGFPSECDPKAPETVPDKIAKIVLDTTPPMPPGDPEQLNHEWFKHGTCSGLGQHGYFSAIKSLTKTIHIPEILKKPTQKITMSREEIVDVFKTVNPGLTAKMIGSKSDPDGNIKEISFCVNKKLKLQECPKHPKEKGGTFLPVR